MFPLSRTVPFRAPGPTGRPVVLARLHTRHPALSPALSSLPCPSRRPAFLRGVSPPAVTRGSLWYCLHTDTFATFSLEKKIVVNVTVITHTHTHIYHVHTYLLTSFTLSLCAQACRPFSRGYSADTFNPSFCICLGSVWPAARGRDTSVVRLETDLACRAVVFSK